MNCVSEIARPSVVAATFEPRTFRIGEKVFESGALGTALRVVSGSLRLDRPGEGESGFASLALKGDVIGAETLLFGRYTFNARALSDCTVEPWLASDDQPAGESLLFALAYRERRAAEVIALRCGQAVDRVKRLLLLLARDGRDGHKSQRVTLPELRDIAEITNLATETVSRSLSRLCSDGIVLKHGWRRAFLAYEFVHGANELALD